MCISSDFPLASYGTLKEHSSPYFQKSFTAIRFYKCKFVVTKCVTLLFFAEKGCQQTFLKIQSMKFCKNLSGKSRVVAFGETDGRIDITNVRPLLSSAVRANLFNFGQIVCALPHSEEKPK